MAKIEIEVGGDLRQAAAETAAAWKNALANVPATPSDKVVFRDWESLYAVLTPRRFALLRSLRDQPAECVRALARRLGRDVKRVHSDVAALEAIGLVSRTPSGELLVFADEINSTIHIAA